MLEHLEKIVVDLETRISAIESRTRARKEIDQNRFVYAIRFLITELWKSIYTIPPRKGIVQFNKNYYNSDYCDPNLKYQGVYDAFEGLNLLGLIETEKFEKDYEKPQKRGKSTRFWIKPNSELYERLIAIQAHPAQIKRGSLDKRVILRERVGKDKVNVNYVNTPQTMQWEANLACINDCLERHWADLKLTETMIPAFLERLAGRRRDYNEDRAHFDLSKRTIGRVFSEGRFDRGGRFFGHWAHNIPNKVKPSNVDEDTVKLNLIKENATPEIISKNLAELKANKISLKFNNEIVLGADSVIDINKELVSKPKDREKALEILKKLNGKTHYLISSVCISKNGSMIWNYTDKAALTMNNLTDKQLEEYLSKITDEALYAYNVYQIEGEGKNLFSKIEGDKNTIMGLPVKKIQEYLKNHK